MGRAWECASNLSCGIKSFQICILGDEIGRHITIAPNHWVEFYLRPRSSLYPSWYGKINSWSSRNHSVVEIESPDEISR